MPPTVPHSIQCIHINIMCWLAEEFPFFLFYYLLCIMEDEEVEKNTNTHAGIEIRILIKSRSELLPRMVYMLCMMYTCPSRVARWRIHRVFCFPYDKIDNKTMFFTRKTDPSWYSHCSLHNIIYDNGVLLLLLLFLLRGNREILQQTQHQSFEHNFLPICK
jgi:hypothetical protein